MNWTIKWQHSLKYVQVDLSGTFCLADARSASSEIVEKTNWKKGDSILIDNTRLDVGNACSSDIESMTIMMDRLNAQVGMSKIAVVGSSDIQFGLARQFQILAEEHTSALIRAFRSATNAIEWLTTNFQPDLSNVYFAPPAGRLRMLPVG